MRIFSLTATLIVLLFSSPVITAQESGVTSQKSGFEADINTAMKSDVRTEREKERDRNRKPVQTLSFFGIDSDMKVLELIPGGGWYTKLLVPALSEKGEYYAAIGGQRIKDRLAENAGFEKINAIDPDIEVKNSEMKGLRTVSAFSFSEKNFDAILTFRNMHNFDAAGRKSVNDAAFKALKPGGIYGVVDHTRRHMEPFTQENRRRADPVQIIKEALETGFELVDYSNLHYRADDELRYEVGRKTVTGNTDRFTLKFRKPK